MISEQRIWEIVNTFKIRKEIERILAFMKTRYGFTAKRYGSWWTCTERHGSWWECHDKIGDFDVWEVIPEQQAYLDTVDYILHTRVYGEKKEILPSNVTSRFTVQLHTYIGKT